MRDHDDMKNKRILLVDDEAGIRNVLKITLESAGYEVSLAKDGEQGLKTFVEEKPLIVITDIKMPGIDGITLLKEIKTLDPETEVIMITGHGDMELAVKSLKYEAGDFISKPIDSNNLEFAIKKAEDRISITRNIRAYMDDLETLVKEKDKKITESETLVTIGQTIAGMSHAIKNIAGGLKGSSFVLEQGIEQENREYLKKGWEMMKGNVGKITQLSLDLLNYAKTTGMNLKPADPNKPAREILQLMKQRASNQNIQFTFIPLSEEKEVLMDTAAIHTCILNLVGNAFDAFDAEIPQKEDEIRSVTLQVGIENTSVTYRVRDNGCGINDTTKDLIFNDFITTKGTRGTGFGLMTTRKIVEQHKGTVRFTSEQKKGSEFVLMIPIRTVTDKTEQERIHGKHFPPSYRLHQ